MRTWKCRKCGRDNPRRLTYCRTPNADGLLCNARKPMSRPPAHMQALNELPYEWWVEEFGERCGICGREPSAKRRLDRDHDHKTGEPRGLLCHRDNRLLASWVTPELLRTAARYLEGDETT